ncbi:MAG TPA: DUF6402 family protein [Variovorax sp.]|nr:DUF6402 family protein [Variovorax sp.]
MQSTFTSSRQKNRTWEKYWLDCPVVQGSIYDKDSMLCPVTNKDYRDWRQRHRQGGDFMIQTDRLSVRLASPIRVVL